MFILFVSIGCVWVWVCLVPAKLRCPKEKEKQINNKLLSLHDALMEWDTYLIKDKSFATSWLTRTP